MKQVGKILEEKAEIYERAKSSLPARAYATQMFPGFNKWRQEKKEKKKDFQNGPIGSEWLGISFGNFERCSLWCK